MLFAHDVELSLSAAAALVNTAGDPDTLTSPEDLDAFVAAWRYTGSRSRGEAELAQVRRVRARLRELWTLDEVDLVEAVNALLRDARALPQLVRHDGFDWHIHAVDPDRPLAERMAVEAAMAFVDVIRMDQTERLKRCAAEDCDGVLADLSKNRSKSYCDRGCGNRMAARAYRARRAGPAGTSRDQPGPAGTSRDQPGLA